MKSRDVSCRLGLLLGGIAVVGMTALTAGCGKGEDKPAETPEPTKTSGAPAPSPEPTQAPSPSGSAPAPAPSGQPASPTEKATTLTPGGPNSFTPSVIAPAAPTALPGNVVTGG